MALLIYIFYNWLFAILLKRIGYHESVYSNALAYYNDNVILPLLLRFASSLPSVKVPVLPITEATLLAVSQRSVTKLASSLWKKNVFVWVVSHDRAPTLKTTRFHDAIFTGDTVDCHNYNNWNRNVAILTTFSSLIAPNIGWALVQIMAWRRPGDKPLSEAYMRHSVPVS